MTPESANRLSIAAFVVLTGAWILGLINYSTYVVAFIAWFVFDVVYLTWRTR